MVYFYLFLLTGIFYLFGNIFLSDWNIIASGLLDGRLTNYVLEHFYLIVSGASNLHTHWWTLPIFYPMQNTLASTDTLFSVAPIYIFFRSLTDYSMAYSMTVITFYILNFSLFYLILRKVNFSKFLSSLGAFIYAFSYINSITLMHIQMITQFFGLGVIYTMMHVSKHNSKKRNLLLFLGASFLYVCQFYSSYYLAFFMYLMALLLVIIAFFDTSLMRKIKVFIFRYKKEITISFFFILALILPAVKIYLGNNIAREYSLVNHNLPVFRDLFTGNTFFITHFLPVMNYEFDVEKMLMFTYILLVFGIIGLLKYKKYGKILLTLFVLSILLILRFQIIGNFSLWQYVYYIIPGAIGVREPVRIILVLNGLLVFGFINFIAKTNWKKWVLGIVIALVIFEQYNFRSMNERSVAREENSMLKLEQVMLPVNCQYIDLNFYLDDPEDFYTNLKMEYARMDVMWFALKYNLYFVSGYSGISESADFGNPYREELQKKPEYCLITKRVTPGFD